MNFIASIDCKTGKLDKNEENPEEITKEIFMTRMEMSEIAVNSDGSITLYYNDGDMFWGHYFFCNIR